MDSNNHPLLHKLNEQQCNAIISRPGPILVLAGPGSGKTRVLTHRIAWMLQEQEIAAWNILAVTFTNKAAREMRTRLDNMVGHNVAQYMTVGTFHAICSRILRREAEHIGLDNNYLIFDTDDQLSVMKEVVKDLGLDDKQYRPRSLLGGISQAKNELIEPVDYPISTYYDEIVSRAYSRYQDILRRSNGVDFDDLLMETVRLFRTQPEVLQKYQERHQHILVDEFQDTNMAQYVLLRLLTHEQRSIFVVADEDQSIYSWRGADARNIQRLRADYPEIKEYLLEENYRSTQVILDAAHSVIQENFNRTPKQLFTRKEGGNRIMLHEAYDEREEADYVAREIKQLLRGDYTPSDIAIMYRTNAQSRALEETLITYNIPYRLIGATRFYSRKEIKDVLAYLRLAQNPDDDVSFQRVINVPTRGIGARTLGKVIEHAKVIQTSYYQAALSLIQQGGLSKRANNALQAFVTLATMWHQSYTTLDVTTLMDNILADTNYERFLRDRTEEGESRWENVMALRAVAADFPDKPLVEFLTDVALVADVDELSEQVEAITLLTLHSAKGLEYPVVFLVGLEEKMLPHSRSMDSQEQIAEERRLLYVGITRAEERLYLTRAFRRSWGGYGSSEPTEPSRFLSAIPDEVLQKPRKAKTTTSGENWGASNWGNTRPTTPSKSSSNRPQFIEVKPTYKKGQRVRHAHYGDGMVIESQITGRDEEVTVIFSGIGIKQLLVGVAPLEPIPDH